MLNGWTGDTCSRHRCVGWNHEWDMMARPGGRKSTPLAVGFCYFMKQWRAECFMRITTITNNIMLIRRIYTRWPRELTRCFDRTINVSVKNIKAVPNLGMKYVFVSRAVLCGYFDVKKTTAHNNNRVIIWCFVLPKIAMITRVSDDPVYWRIYASPGLSELTLDIPACPCHDVIMSTSPKMAILRDVLMMTSRHRHVGIENIYQNNALENVDCDRPSNCV